MQSIFIHSQIVDQQLGLLLRKNCITWLNTISVRLIHLSKKTASIKDRGQTDHLTLNASNCSTLLLIPILTLTLTRPKRDLNQ